MNIEIKCRWSSSVLFNFKCGSAKEAVEEAVKRGANLRGANLRGANLRGAYLGGANLRGANHNDKTIWPNGAIVKRPPVSIIGALPWPVTILGSHVIIGCQIRPAAEWESMTDELFQGTFGGDSENAVELRSQWINAISAFRDREAEAECAAKITIEKSQAEAAVA